MDVKNLLPRDKHDTSSIGQLLRLTDAEIEPILPELLTWLQDVNWPVTVGICEVIGKHAKIVDPLVLAVLQGTDEIWKYNILSRLLCEWKEQPIGERLLSEIQRIAAHPTVGEVEEEVNLAAAELLESYGQKDSWNLIHSNELLPLFFMITERIGFSHWKDSDSGLAQSLWGNPQVTRYICASGVFTEAKIQKRLQFEVECQQQHGVQYWPFFSRSNSDLIGCCGLHPHGEGCYELGFHLRPAYWHQGYATEAAKAVMEYAFHVLHVDRLFAGHNPNNTASRAVLMTLGFEYIGDEFYPPTGLNHPSYIRTKTSWDIGKEDK